MRCIICGLEKEASKEHIIPEAMGNKKFVTYKVCQDCNNKLGAKVDNYLIDHLLVKMMRKNQRLLGKEEKEIKIFPSVLLDNNGEKFVFKSDIPAKPSKTELHEGILHIEADTIEEALELGRKKLVRVGFSSEEIDKFLETYQVREIRRYLPTFHLKVEFNLSRYLLGGVKIAYEFACNILNDSYLNDEIAIKLRELLYKAANSDVKKLSSTIDHSVLKQYASLLQEEARELLNRIKPLLNDLDSPVRHVCILHDSADNKLVCEVILLLENTVSFTILVSKNAIKYDMKEKTKLVLILEDGK